MKLTVLGCFSPNYEFKPVSMYKLELKEKIIYLDLGYGNHNKVDMDNLNKSTFVISHNHVDHAYGLVTLLKKLKKNKIKLENKIKIYMPKATRIFGIYSLLSKETEYFDITFINPDLKINIEDYEITFVRTLHKGESYGIKLTNRETKKVFVYTSDMAKVTDNVISFCKDADIVMMESGHPVFFQPFTLGKYHGYTRHMLADIIKANPKYIYLTHFKTYASDKMFERWYPKTDIKIELVRLNKTYEI